MNELTCGYLPVRDGWVWYQIQSRHLDATPLLVLHGGPAAGYRYLQSLAAIASERPVVFYDQLGCGRSEEPEDVSLWQIQRFVDEIDAVRDVLQLEQVHLFGHSWGGWLAIEYMLTRPAGVKSLVLASTSASLPEYVHEINRLREALPAETYKTLLQYEAMGDFQNPEYKGAVLEFYQRHLCRLDPWPQVMINNVRDLATSVVYETLQGPNEFVITGNLRAWDRSDRLHEIDLPVLITVGRYDEVTPACAETLRRGLSKARLKVFEQSAHMAHFEQEERYLEVLKSFLREVETD